MLPVMKMALGLVGLASLGVSFSLLLNCLFSSLVLFAAVSYVAASASVSIAVLLLSSYVVIAGEMGAWIVSTLVGCMGGVPLCLAGLSNGRVVVFRLGFAAAAAAGDSSSSSSSNGDTGSILRGVSRRTGASVSVSMSLLSGRVVYVGKGPVRLVSLPSLHRGAVSRRKHRSSSHRGASKGRGGGDTSSSLRGVSVSPQRRLRGQMAARHQIACVVCCCSTPTIIHVSAAGRDLFLCFVAVSFCLLSVSLSIPSLLSICVFIMLSVGVYLCPLCLSPCISPWCLSMPFLCFLEVSRAADVSICLLPPFQGASPIITFPVSLCSMQPISAARRRTLIWVYSG